MGVVESCYKHDSYAQACDFGRAHALPRAARAGPGPGAWACDFGRAQGACLAASGASWARAWGLGASLGVGGGGGGGRRLGV